MKNLREPSAVQDLLFDDDECGWWSSQLHPSALKRLENGFEGIFRRTLLQLMPVDRLSEHFSKDFGRPTKELYSIAGLILIAEFRDYTIEETAQAYACDSSIQFALNLPRNNQYVCPRTIDNYRKLFREDDLAQEVFLTVTRALVSELDIDIKKQRLDSTHVLSNMAVFSRYQLVATGVKRFLQKLKKHCEESFQSIDQALRERYEASDQRLYFGAVANPSKVTSTEKRKVLLQIGKDIQILTERFKSDETITALDAYQKMNRLFFEHFEQEETTAENRADNNGDDDNNDDDTTPKQEIKIRPSSVSINGGGKSGTLQNTSDEDAGYDGHKGAGHKAHIAQSLPPLNSDQEVEGPGMITGLLPESAGSYDGNGLKPMLEQQRDNQLLPEQCTADSHFGSDENVLMAEGEFGVKIISPVSGARAYPKPTDQPGPAKPGTKAAEKQAQKQRLDRRREVQQTDEWQRSYAPRSGIEGLNRALDLKTGFKKLRVRGKKAVAMALFCRAVGWNISTAAKIKQFRERKASLLAWFGRKRRSLALQSWLRRNRDAGKSNFFKITQSLAS